MDNTELKPLSKKHQRVLDEYLKCWKQWEAYQKVYPKATYDSARSLSSELFANPNFSAHLQLRLNEVHMGANEALKLMADIARGDIADFMSIGSMGFSLDLQSAQEAGKTNLIKKVRQQTITINGKDQDKEIHTIDLELYDRQSAIRDFLKLHGKLTERVDLTSGGEKLANVISIVEHHDSDEA